MSQSVDWESDDDFVHNDGEIRFCGGSEARNFIFKAMNHFPFECRAKYVWCIAFNIIVAIVIITVVVLVSLENTTDPNDLSSNNTNKYE